MEILDNMGQNGTDIVTCGHRIKPPRDKDTLCWMGVLSARGKQVRTEGGLHSVADI